MKNLLLICVCFTWIAVRAQTITPQVLNSAGSHQQVGNSGISITDNVGEPFTESVGYGVKAMMITEGFIQPETVTKSGFTLDPIQQNLQCMDKEDDAFISLSIKTPVPINKYTAKYYWTPSSVCPNNDCAKIDTLKAGGYSVIVRITYTTNVGAVRNDSLSQSFSIADATTPCTIKVFNGVSANHDHVNDYLIIENIKEYPNNTVSVFNRWGNLVYEVKGYDQDISGKRWPEDDVLSKLTSSTYFYIIDLGNGVKPMKGWVELIKNE
jgi:gliding motility-associated-like protein